MNLYYSALANNNKFICRKFLPWCQPAHWLMTLILNNKKNKLKFIKYMKSNKVECRSMVHPIFEAAFMKKKYWKKDFPVSKYISERSIHLPSGTGLSEFEINKICKLVNNFFSKYV